MTTTPQVRSSAIYPNSPPRGSGKTGRKSLTLAADMARQLGMVPTWPNVQTIRLAIESEAEYSAIEISEAAALILQAAHETTRGPEYFHLSSWEISQLCKQNDVDRFWFEDARWRMKAGYWQWLEKLRSAEAS